MELQQLHAGHRHVNNNTPGHRVVVDRHPGAEAHDGQRDELRLHAQPVGLHGWSGDQAGTTSITRRCTARTLGHQRAAVRSRSATTRIRRSSRASADRRSTSGRTRRVSRTSGGNRCRPGRLHPTNWTPAAAPEHERARVLGRRPVDGRKGRHNFKAGVSLEFNHKTEPGSADYMGNYNFGNDANNPLNTGNGYANMLLGVFTPTPS